MILADSSERTKVTIGLLGASFDTGNMGVSALAESSIKCILHRWLDAEVFILGSTSEERTYQLELMGKQVRVTAIPIRFCKNIFLPNHFLVLLLCVLAARVLPRQWTQRYLVGRNRYFAVMTRVNLLADITAGDSFSDIYGMRRFVLGFLQKWLVLKFRRPFIMLPQTYGPFRRKLTRCMAKSIIRQATVAYSRDKGGIRYLARLADGPRGKFRFVPDLAFVLDSRRPRNIDEILPPKTGDPNSLLVGVNVSGLLFHGGYDRNNMFRLESDYRQLICDVVKMLLKYDGTTILLIPHVFSPSGTVDSDPDACEEVFDIFRGKYDGRLFLLGGKYDQNEIKFIIGRCDFFVGSRMHACIAAMSQYIPTVGLAYSKKFHGVFESVNLGNCVVDASSCDGQNMLEMIESAFKQRNQIHNQLEQVMPQVKENILGIFSNYNGSGCSNGI